MEDYPNATNPIATKPGLDGIMTSWTKQKGHPVVHVSMLDSTHLLLTQTRFVTDSTFKLADLQE